ncbi:hypothetical protein BDV36DRAFT_291799 [Aspergillus pseudocaelatus]|uniref:P-loop containing nucleoside triphosphate hydrolase protein n=1 Tax=Aspergillus pseudocaelatus TaxID=1825620 RepID=A0ABQ6X062_9EURO|nr:hypothetical protein BDV36DRAFT_291799 [Aspergillus pseudocaelatus]
MEQFVLASPFVGGVDNCSDTAFGPVSCSRSFDFTLTFEQSILSILPSAFLILASPLRLTYLVQRRPRTVKSKWRLLKIVSDPDSKRHRSQAAKELATYHNSAPFATSTSLPAAALSLVDAVLILCLTYVEDRQLSRPSTLLNVYLLFSTLFDAVQARTLWLNHQSNMATVLTAIVGIKAILLCLESRSKAAYLQPPYSKLPPESTSGIINLSLFWWLNALFRMGYRQLITTEDLFDIDPSLKADVIGREMQDAWNIRAKPEGQMALPKAVLFILRWNLFSVAVPRLCMIGFNFAQPFLITAAINYMDESEPHNKNVKYGLIGATFLIYFGIAISAAHYRRCFARVLTKFRGSMIALLYNKSLTIQVGHCTESAALTLMSTDIDNIINLLENIVDIWARLVEIGIGIWLLARQIGAVCLTPPIITAVCAIGQLWIAKSIGTDQQKWNESIQQRVRDISSMLGSMKAIKIAGLARPVARNVQDQRETELRIARAFFMGIMWLNGLANFPAIWSPVISFIVFSIQAKITGSQSLTSVRAFTSLSIIALVTAPAEKLLAVLPHIAAALGCFQRLQEYMLSDSMKDTRVFEPLIVSPFCDNEGDDDSLEGTPKSTDAIRLANVTVLPAPKATSLAISNASCTIETGSLTILLGPIGCGKTTLLKAILGELPCSSGNIYISSKKMSFCSQLAWLLNTSIKDSICGLSNAEFDNTWYETVIEACALSEDIRQWPEGDRTIIGSKGLTLSGGQKQRVALARAVYSRQDIAFLDDILSALDIETQEHIAARLFSKTGLVKRLGTTVVLSTHTARCIHYANKIIVLDAEGNISMETSYESMKETDQLEKFAPTEGDGKHNNKLLTSEDTDVNQDPTAIQDEKSLELMDVTRRTGDLAVYAYYFRTIQPGLWIAFLVIHIVAAFSDSFPQIWLSWWTTYGGHLAMRFSVYALLALAASVFSVSCIWIIFLEIMPAKQIQNRYLDYSQRPHYLLLCIQRWLSLVLDLLVTALAVLVVALAIEMRSTTSGGLIGVSLNNVLSFNQSLSTFVTAWTSLETSLGAIARVKTLSKMTPNENKPDENKELPERWPETGAIEIDRVSVKYANGANALSDVTIKISPGQKIGRSAGWWEVGGV